MVYRRFMDYCLVSRTNVFMKWYWAQHPAIQAAFEYALKETAVTEDLEQCRTFKPLTKTHLGLCEIKFSADDKSGTGIRKIRVLGFWNYDESDFVLVSGGKKPIPETIFQDVMEKLRNKEYRSNFAALQLKRGVPFQIRTLLKKREWTQEQLAESANLTQGVVSRAQNPDYGNLTINTISRIASGFDVGFVGQFVPFSRLVEW